MTDKVKTYTAEQNKLIAEISSTYGTEQNDILFFTDDPSPFFGFETSCVMLNRLATPKAIDIEPRSALEVHAQRRQVAKEIRPLRRLPESEHRSCRRFFTRGVPSPRAAFLPLHR